jgi:hypothetical protein
MLWTGAVPLKELLAQLVAPDKPLYSPNLVAMMQKTNGIAPEYKLKFTN